MLKKLLKYSCFNILFIFIACAPKPEITPPSVYLEEDLSLEEIITEVGNDTETLKAIAAIKIEQNNELYDFINASVLVKRPGWVHMRIYKFGMLIKDFIIKDNDLYILSGKGNEDLKKLGREFYNAVFWWDDIRNGLMYRENEKYIIRTSDREIYLDRATLIPLKQEIFTSGRKISITYHKPVQAEDGFWYPSVIEIYLGNFKFTVTLKKLLKNPLLGEFDFKIPVEG
jgi:hypothetical protein